MISTPFKQVCEDLSLLNGVIERIVRMGSVRAQAWHQPAAACGGDGDMRLDSKCGLDIEALRVVKRRTFTGEFCEIPVEEAPVKTERIGHEYRTEVARGRAHLPVKHQSESHPR